MEKQKISKFSIRLPRKMKFSITKRAAQLDLKVSQYMRRLVNAEINGRSEPKV